MGEFFRAAKQAKLLRLARKAGFDIDQGAKHIKVTSPDGQWTVIPRSKILKSGTSESICNFLLEHGVDKELIKKVF